MSVTYAKAGEQVTKHLNEIIGQEYKTLAELKVVIGIIMASNDDGPAVKENGFPTTGSIKVTNLLERVTKEYDAELILDSAVWHDSNEDRKTAILDHYLYQLQLVPNSEKKIALGESIWKEDDLGRPKLKLRQGDWGIGVGFKEMCKRYKENAVEFLHLAQCYEKAKKAVED